MAYSYQPSIQSNYLLTGHFEQEVERKLMEWLIREKGQPVRTARLLWKKIKETLESRSARSPCSEEVVIWSAVQRIADEELIKLKAAMDKNFGLTEDAFSDLADSLRGGDDGLFEQIFLQHFESCMSYLKRQYKATHEDAYDASMHTLLEFHHRIRDGKIQYGNLRFLFTRMAGQYYFKWIKKENLTTELSDLDLADPPEDVDPEMLAVLDKAWNLLCDKCRGLLKAFYYDKKTLAEIAEAQEKDPAAIRKQKQRCVEKLRDSFTQQS